MKQQVILIPEPKKVLTIQDFASKMGVSRQMVYRWIASGHIQTIKLGSQQFIDKDTKRPSFN